MLQHKWLNKLERRFGKFAIPHLMTVLIFGMAIVAVVDIFSPPDYEVNLSSILAFDREAIFSGQAWRIVTFIFMPPGYFILTIAFTLYFYWLIGAALEAQWGSFRFNVYYFTGMIGTIIGGFITGYATNYYLDLSLFLAFALLYPEHKVYLFFVLPIKMKYLALIDVLFTLYLGIFSSWPERIALLISVINVVIFFIPELIYQCKLLGYRLRSKKRKNQMNGGLQQNKSWKNHWWDDKDNDPFK